MESWGLAFDPLFPLPVLWTLAGAGALLCALLLHRLGPRALARVGALALLLFALAGPSLVRQTREPLKDIVALVVDRSDSQKLDIRAGQTEAAAQAVEASLRADPNVELRVVGADPASDDETRLFGPLRRAFADAPPERIGGAIVITDGQVHDIPADAPALGFAAPVHALITGRADERDRRVEMIEAPRFGIVGKDADFRLRVAEAGGTGEAARLVVRRDGEVVAERRVAPGVEIALPLRVEHGGANVFDFAVDAVPGELTERNNRVVATLEGVRDRLKVLLVSGEPHAGERTWRNLLRSDANVELVHFTILRHPDTMDPTPVNEMALIAFPTADLFVRKLKEFDLVIFDRYSNQRVLPQAYLENIARYVREGGALLLAVGPDFSTPSGIFNSPVGAVIPGAPTGELIERPFKPQISPEGARHPVARGLAGAGPTPQWSDWFRQVAVEKTRGAVVLEGANDKPLLILSREGKGRVAELLSDQIWLWARGYEGGGPYADLLRRLSHWLMKEPDLEEEALRASARGRAVAVERQTLSQADEPVEITAPSGARTQLRLAPAREGLAEGAFEAKETGLYRLTSGALTALVNVGASNPPEFRDVVSTTEKLAPLAQASGGSVRRLPANGAAPRVLGLRPGPSWSGSDWIAFRRNDAARVSVNGATPLGLGLAAALLALALFAGAWLLEGRR